MQSITVGHALPVPDAIVGRVIERVDDRRTELVREQFQLRRHVVRVIRHNAVAVRHCLPASERIVRERRHNALVVGDLLQPIQRRRRRLKIDGY